MNRNSAGRKLKRCSAGLRVELLEKSMKPQESSSPSVLWSVLLILFGLLAIALPVATSFGVARILAWVILFDGLVQLFYAFRSEGVGRTIWKVVVALLYLAAGIYLLTHPMLGLAGLTLMLALFLCAEGLMDLGTFLVSAKSKGSLWLLLHGAVTFILGIMIWRRWPISSFWSVGILVGISILLNGITRLMMAFTLREKRA
jgi:uncharacterized membrane protein HdeD (DUF308 family)